MRKMFNILNIGAVVQSVAYLQHAMMTLRLATCHFHGRLHSFMPVAWATACLMALAGCSSDETVSEAADTPQTITFSQFASPLQRAAELDYDYMTGLLRTYGFAVYGTKKAYSTSEQSLFTNTHVQWDATNTAWYYSPLRYWDRTATYNFSAIAPYEEGPTHYSQIFESSTNTWRWQVANIGFAKEGATPTNDYVIQRSTPIEVNGSDHTNGMNPPVTFQLHHIMAKVSFKIKKSAEMEDVTVTVKSLTMTGWKSGNGTFKQNATDPTNGTTPNCSEWNIANNGTSGSYDIGTATLIGADGTGAENEDLVLSTDPTTLTDAYIMVPQTIAANELKFKLTYTLEYSDGMSEDYTDYEGVLTTAQTWGTDTHTTYTLTIGPKPIKFDVTINNFDGTDKSYDIVIE